MKRTLLCFQNSKIRRLCITHKLIHMIFLKLSHKVNPFVQYDHIDLFCFSWLKEKNAKNIKVYSTIAGLVGRVHATSSLYVSLPNRNMPAVHADGGQDVPLRQQAAGDHLLEGTESYD